MRIPLEISYRGVEKTEPIEALLHEKCAKLERYCDHINSCRISIEKPQEHQTSGNPYRVRLDITIPPGKEIAVIKGNGKGDMHKELHAVIRDAFDAARRQVQKINDKQNREVKLHTDNIAQAIVNKIFPDDGYGFLKTLDGRNVYFHQHSVLHDDFSRLAIGTSVRFVEEIGEKGPQATSVQIIDKPGKKRKE